MPQLGYTEALDFQVEKGVFKKSHTFEYFELITSAQTNPIHK